MIRALPGGAEEEAKKDLPLELRIGTESPGNGSCATSSLYLDIKPDAFLFLEALKALCEAAEFGVSGTVIGGVLLLTLLATDRLLGVWGSTAEEGLGLGGVMIFVLLKACANDIGDVADIGDVTS